jgi:hypothetical protein
MKLKSYHEYLNFAASAGAGGAHFTFTGNGQARQGNYDS